MSFVFRYLFGLRLLPSFIKKRSTFVPPSTCTNPLFCSLKCSDDGAIFIFDDYGLFPEVKKAIDEYIEAKIFKGLTKIGHPKGTFYPTTQNKILKDYEGIICQRV